MELHIIEDTKDKVIFELVGADNTISNILKEYVTQQKGVLACSYTIEHPLVSHPKFFVQADNAKAALEAALKALQKEVEDLKKQAEKL
ncbi:MAG: RpoL/Rpb11 RNA polymerase subunit family protein [Candidatus Woesearchaeota archaeon]